MESRLGAMGLCVHRLRASGKMRACARVATSSRGQIAIASANGRGQVMPLQTPAKGSVLRAEATGGNNITISSSCFHQSRSRTAQDERMPSHFLLSLESATDNYRAPLQQSQAQTHRAQASPDITIHDHLSLSPSPRTPSADALASLTRGKPNAEQGQGAKFPCCGQRGRPGRHVSEQA